MVSKNEQDELPCGWKLQIKVKNGRKYKYYINATTHQKLYSKLSMLRYIKDGCTSNKKVKHIDEHNQEILGKNQMQLVQANDYDWLPPGWIVERRFRKSGPRVGTEYKCFIDPSTGHSFFSKPEVLRYLGSKQDGAGLSRRKGEERSGHPSSKYIKDGCTSNGKVPHTNKKTKKTSHENQMQLVQANDYEWLPTGWIVERRFRKSGPRVGTEYKCFVDPSSGSKFFSKPEVLRYLGSKQSSPGLSRGKGKERSEHSSNKAKVSQITKPGVHKGFSNGKLKIVVEKTVDENLPSGWIKETRIKMLGDKAVRKNPFFADSASRLVFRSKLEVLRYVKTGEISRHAYWRRDGKINGDDLAITMSSGSQENKSKRRARKQNFKGKGISERSIEAPPKAGGPEKIGGKKSKTSSTTRTAPGPKKNALSPESIGDSLGKCEFSSESSKGVILEENPLAVVVHDCYDKKFLSTKRKIKDEKATCTPLRSSKRLAGVDAEVVVLPTIPIEHALRTTSQKSLRTRPIPINPNLESVPNEKQEKHEDVDSKHLKECAVKVTSKKKSKFKPSPSLEFVPKELHENCQAADTEILNEEELQATDRSKSVRSELLPCSESAPNELHEKQKDVGKENMHATQREPLLKKINEKHQVIDSDEKLQVEQPLSKIESSSTFEEQCQRLDQEDLEIIFASQGEPFYKIDDLPAQEVVHHHTFDVDSKNAIATRGESSSKIDLQTKEPTLVDPNVLQLDTPPGFSGYAKVGVSTITTKQSVQHPVGTSQGSKSEQQMVNNEKQTEQPESELCSLWSDPCLEFAYKTLTGAIPFDDNLAIQDYIQHQLSPPEQNLDISTPSFFRKEESKLVWQLPEDVNFLNSSSIGSQRNQAGKKISHK